MPSGDREADNLEPIDFTRSPAIVTAAFFVQDIERWGIRPGSPTIKAVNPGRESGDCLSD